MGWDISPSTYKDRIEQLLKNLKELYNEVEGGFFLFWVEDSLEKRVGCSYTGHYSVLLEDSSMTRGVRNYFATWCKNRGERACDASVIDWVNPWLINFQAEHLITVVPKALQRTNKELNRARRERMKTLLISVTHLCEFCDIPFIFYYTFFDKDLTTRPYACPPDAAEALYKSVFFKKLIDPSNTVDLPRLDYLSPFKKPRLSRSLTLQQRQPRSFTRLDFSTESGADDQGSWVDEHLPYNPDDTPDDVDFVSIMFYQMRHKPELIRPTVIANSEDMLQVVMHDSRRSAQGEIFISNKLVLVSLERLIRAEISQIACCCSDHFCRCYLFHCVKII